MKIIKNCYFIILIQSLIVTIVTTLCCLFIASLFMCSNPVSVDKNSNFVAVKIIYWINTIKEMRLYQWNISECEKTVKAGTIPPLTQYVVVGCWIGDTVKYAAMDSGTGIIDSSNMVWKDTIITRNMCFDNTIEIDSLWPKITGRYVLELR
jgi:hypothetical protein